MSVGRVYRTGSPYNASELAEVDYEQSADTMYLAHLDHHPTKLVRAGHTSWSFSSITFAPTIAAPGGVGVVATTPNTDAANSGASYFPLQARYVVTAVDDDTGHESRASAAVSATNDLGLKKNYNTITWAAVTGAEHYRIYKSEVTSDFGYIGSTDQLSFTDNNIGPDLSDGPPNPQNPFPTSNDYPSTVAFYQQRLGWARTDNHPNAVYFSRAGEYENMDESRPLKASDALSFALVAGKVNAINQLVAMNQLLALTSDSVFAVNGGQDGFLTPSNIVTQRQTGRGSSRLNPLVVDNVAFYQPSIGGGVRTLGYEFSTDGYNSNDIAIFSPHMFREHTIISWAYAAEPLSIIWAARDDGKLLAFTWQQEQQVWGWTLCETDGIVESVTSISENGEDRVYLSVIRNGKRLIERLASAFWDTVDDACFMDAAVTYVFDDPATVLTNLAHLEGKAVVAVADGSVVQGLTVSQGKVTLSDPASRVTIGLPFTATVETLPLAQQTPQGWTLAKPQQVTKVALRVIKSRGFLAGPTIDKLALPRPRHNEPMGSPPSLVSGIVEAVMQPDIRGINGDAGVTVVIQSPDPLPLTLAAVFYDPTVSQ
jgi:hypothetical protein